MKKSKKNEKSMKSKPKGKPGPKPKKTLSETQALAAIDKAFYQMPDVWRVDGLDFCANSPTEAIQAHAAWYAAIGESVPEPKKIELQLAGPLRLKTKE